MRPERLPTWPGGGAVRRAASVAGRPFHTVIGRPPRWCAACVWMVSRRPWSSTAPWMAPPFVPTPAPSWVRVFASATSLCWITLRLTKFKGSAKRSASREPHCCTCRRTHRISIRLSRRMRSSRRCFARLQHAPLTAWSRPSPRPWRRFHLRNAPTSPMQDIKQRNHTLWA